MGHQLLLHQLQGRGFNHLPHDLKDCNDMQRLRCRGVLKSLLCFCCMMFAIKSGTKILCAEMEASPRYYITHGQDTHYSTQLLTLAWRYVVQRYVQFRRSNSPSPTNPCRPPPQIASAPQLFAEACKFTSSLQVKHHSPDSHRICLPVPMHKYF